MHEHRPKASQRLWSRRYAIGLGLIALPVLGLLAVLHSWVPLLIHVHAPNWQGKEHEVLSGYVAVQQAHPIAGIGRNLSGLTWSTHSQTLYGVINRPPVVVELSADGELLNRWPLPQAVDPEGISHIHGELFVVSDEGQQALHWLRIQPQSMTVATAEEHFAALPAAWQGGSSQTQIAALFANAGLEAVAWDALHSRLLLGNERFPRRIYALDGGGPGPALHWRPQNWFGLLGNDVAGLAVHPENGQVFMLSEASALIAQYSHEGELLGVLPLRAGHAGLQQGIPQPEGIALAPDGTLWVVSEPNLFYRFQRVVDGEPG